MDTTDSEFAEPVTVTDAPAVIRGATDCAAPIMGVSARTVAANVPEIERTSRQPVTVA